MGFQLEPDLALCTAGTMVNVKVRVLMTGDGYQLCSTVLRHQLVYVPLSLQGGDSYSIFGVTTTMIGTKLHLVLTPETKVISHPPFAVHSPPRVIETCAGIGAVGHGMHMCGTTTVAYNDSNHQWCTWLQARTDTPVIEGDLNDPAVIHSIASVAQGAEILSSGVSCQPFSGLGDRKEGNDPRSASLTGSLQLGFHLQPAWIILECTREARTSPWAQQVFQAFAQQSGYHFHQEVVDLHNIWPGLRTRWWGVFSHPLVPAATFQNLPKLSFVPSLIHVVPRLLSPPDEQIDQLNLDQHETRVFNHYRRLVDYNVDMLRPMPTATHSWGSQVKACECGCRDRGFSQSRLDNKGLYGCLCFSSGEVETPEGTMHQMRHLHPQEVALFTGLTPNWVQPRPDNGIRLDLAGVGQCASPIQSAWVLSQVLQGAADAGVIPPVPTPKEILWKVCHELLEVRDQVCHQTYADFPTSYPRLVGGPCRDPGA